ncbi:ComF family protein [uncultured Duncaniella sp.]|uniref:ComF family protein n=1 Tax=uncultured Duncaniella sp. TaxID=2768039 RepID=UPI0025DF38D6|nr:hypothetical protein [uncultured Duncaniella sp.]
MINELKRWGNGLINLIIPKVCTVCHRALVEGEDIMCLDCMLKLPKTTFRSYETNELTDRLVSLKAPVTKANSLYYYVASTPYVRLIHDAKYNRRPIVARALAAYHAKEMLRQGFFDDIDVIIPIPLHFTKLWKRGYNQSQEIALGLSEVTGIAVSDNLTAPHRHATQTHKNASERRLNPVGAFRVKYPEELDNLHILLVDDVITTGSTILSGLEELHSASPSSRLSVYSLAITKMV